MTEGTLYRGGRSTTEKYYDPPRNRLCFTVYDRQVFAGLLPSTRRGSAAMWSRFPLCCASSWQRRNPLDQIEGFAGLSPRPRDRIAQARSTWTVTEIYDYSLLLAASGAHCPLPPPISGRRCSNCDGSWSAEEPLQCWRPGGAAAGRIH